MELFSRAISPFAARVRISVRAKRLDVRVIDDPDVTSDAFARLNPYRRVPVLALDDGTALPESQVIVDYLEDRYPEVALRPSDAHARANANLIARAAELYVFPAAVELLRRGAAATGLETELERQLQRLAALIDPARESWHVIGDRLTTADAALAPFFVYIDMLGALRQRSYFAAHDSLQQFWKGAPNDPTLSHVMQEMRTGLQSARKAARP